MDLNLVWAWVTVFSELLETSNVADSGCLSRISDATRTKKNRGKIKNYCPTFYGSHEFHKSRIIISEKVQEFTHF